MKLFTCLTSLAGVSVAGLMCIVSGCIPPIPRDALVLTQTPRAAQQESVRDELDARYPYGSRIVVACGSPIFKVIRVLSEGLIAAGEPVISADGRRLVFAGKASPEADWQIYEAGMTDGKPRALTAVNGGAKDPALLPDGSLLYVAPVQKLAIGQSTGRIAELYAFSFSGTVRQLTFSSTSVSDPTVLADGRILFAAAQPGNTNHFQAGLALYTINNDGTEISAFAGQHDEPRLVWRPRQLEDGRIVFVEAQPGDSFTAQTVRSARPFGGRGPLLPDFKGRIYSVQPAANGDLLVCAGPAAAAGNPEFSCAVFRLAGGGQDLGVPLLADADWNTIEALQASASRRPMGRLSNVDPSHTTGQILCLDANKTSCHSGDQPCTGRAKRIRVFTIGPSAVRSNLGEVAVQADGSFMAEVPADRPLGFEALDDQGAVLRRDPAMVWVRPGENRSCIGCHEPHNHSPKNFRPLAVRAPVPRLGGDSGKLAQNSL